MAMLIHKRNGVLRGGNRKRAHRNYPLMHFAILAGKYKAPERIAA
jgi:hypothetical protein